MSGYLALLRQMDALENVQGANCANRVKTLHGLRSPDIDEKKSAEPIRPEVTMAPAVTADVSAAQPAPLPRTAPIYRRLLALAPAAGLDEDQATYIVGVRVGILSEYQDCDDALLAEVLRGWARERAAMCATCGPVWLPQHWPRRVAGCPWCARVLAGLPIPRPPFGP